MTLKDRIIVEDYRKNREDFIRLGDLVHEKLTKLAESAGVRTLGIEHRVKQEASLIGKLDRKGDTINVFEDLTDILGARIICYFSDDVDKLGKLVEKEFVIYPELSVDKRAILKPSEFGYMSLHYIASLPQDEGVDEALTSKKFEIQIRTILQHAWSDINHDMGYKSEFGVPDECAREFSKLSCLLEVADDSFVRVRDKMKAYTDDIRDKIKNDQAEGVPMNMVSLKEYVLHNTKMQEFLSSLAALCGAEISIIDPESYVDQLKWLGKETIGDVQNMLDEDRDLAYKLAVKSLTASDLDILSSNVGLRFLTRAELLNKGYTHKQAEEFLAIQTGREDRGQRQAKYLYDTYEKLKEQET